MKNLGRLLRTIRYLKYKQILFRIYYRLKKPRLPLIKSNQILIRPTHHRWLVVCPATDTVKSPTLFTFLNATRDISAASIWNEPDLPKLWLYHLHYFACLTAPEATLSLQEKLTLIQRWIKENSSVNTVGWEPYPVSLRIVNWIKFLLLHPQASTANILDSLYIQAKFLSTRLEYHILGNHLLANAKALIFAGLYFATAETEKLYQRGLNIYCQELKQQILADGGHFELSPMYQAIILEDLLDIIQLHHIYQRPFPEQWLVLATKMLYWLQIMTHPDQQPAFFNDTAIGGAACYCDLVSYARQLQIALPDPVVDGIYTLRASGYYRLQKNNIVAICDIAPIGPDYLPGHAHADSLSFELSLGSQRILVNSGISLYDNTRLRHEQRSTIAHNTATVDQKNSSEVWGSFRVGRRAKPYDITIKQQDDSYTISGKHDGYQHINNIIHQRTWQLNTHQLTTIDHISGNSQIEHEVEIRYYFHPQLILKQLNNNKVLIYDTEHTLLANFICLLPCTFTMQQTYYYPEFGKQIANQCLKIKIEKTLPVTTETHLIWI